MKDQLDDSTFYIPNASTEGPPISLCGHKTRCPRCHRKILVQLPVIDAPTHLDATAVCAECLDIGKEFKEDHPEIAEDLIQWKKL